MQHFNNIKSVTNKLVNEHESYFSFQKDLKIPRKDLTLNNFDHLCTTKFKPQNITEIKFPAAGHLESELDVIFIILESINSDVLKDIS